MIRSSIAAAFLAGTAGALVFGNLWVIAAWLAFLCCAVAAFAFTDSTPTDDEDETP